MRRALAAVALCLAVSACGSDHHSTIPAPTVPAPLPAPRNALPSIPPSEALGAELVRATVLRTSPGGHFVVRMATRTSFGSRRVLAVVSRRGAWVGVLSPALPNGRTGWVRASDVTLVRETWSIDIDLSRRLMTLRHRGRTYYRTSVAIGRAPTSTPTGVYGVTDRLRTTSPSSPYGCCVLALSGRQPNVPQDWRGGDRIAIHGTSQPATIGEAASLGCIRASASAMRALMARVPLGTPVRIRA